MNTIEQNQVPHMPKWMKKMHTAQFAEDMKHPERVLPDSVSIETFLEASVDELTGLSSRKCFLEIMEKGNTEGIQGAVLMVDANNLHEVNQYGGHMEGKRDEKSETGDFYLKSVAHALDENLQKKFLGRLGGDEFGVLVLGIGKKDLSHLVERLTRIFGGGVDEQGHLIPTVCIGAVHTDDVPTDARDQLLFMADQALGKAKDHATELPLLDEEPVTFIGKVTVDHPWRKQTVTHIYDPATDGVVKRKQE